MDGFVLPLETSPASERRRTSRRGLLQRGQIVAGASIYDCFILDGNDTGVRVQMATPVSLPERVAIRLPDGTMATATHRWSRGTESGFAFDELQAPLPAPVVDLTTRATAICAALHEGRFDSALRQLRAARYLDDDGLRGAAEEAEAACARLAAAVSQRALAAATARSL
jgi:hypothetical protein